MRDKFRLWRWRQRNRFDAWAMHHWLRFDAWLERTACWWLRWGPWLIFGFFTAGWILIVLAVWAGEW